jgi:hypothetical protein
MPFLHLGQMSGRSLTMAADVDTKVGSDPDSDTSRVDPPRIDSGSIKVLPVGRVTVFKVMVASPS